jgi:hypothetical protein
MQFCATHDRKQNSIVHFKDLGYLSAVYMRALRRFLQWSGLNEPVSVLDWRIHLFSVVCDYAMCPTAGYFGSLGNPTNLLDRFHPGARFRRACEVIASRGIAMRLSSKFPSEFAVNHQFMITAYEEIEGAIRVGTEVTYLDACKAIGNFANTLLAAPQRQPNPSEISYPTMWPLFNLLRRHFANLDRRLGKPDFYYDPLTIALDEPQSLPFLLPPTVSTKDGFQFINIIPKKWNRRRGDGGMELLVGFYIGQVYSDLVRQLISDKGPFKYDFAWLPPEWAKVAVEGGKRIFETYFGKSIDDVVLQ